MANLNSRPSVNIGKNNDDNEAEKNVTEQAFSSEETANQLLVNEDDFLQGLIDSVDYVNEEQIPIEVIRTDSKTGKKKVLYRFRIKPLSEDEYQQCRKKHTKYVRNKSLGVKMPEDTNTVKYRDEIIYKATVPEDRKKLWDNKQAWEALRSKGLQIMNGLDVIEYSLKAGEKDKILEEIDRISGYDESNLEEVVKN